jgi:hypothetical protein
MGKVTKAMALQRARQARYRNSAKGKATAARYNNSEEGKANYERSLRHAREEPCMHYIVSVLSC